MADSDAHTGFGAMLQRGDGQSPENFVTVLGVKSISGPNITRETHDVSDQAQKTNFREFIGGMVDAGELSFEANFLPRDPTQNQHEGGFMAEFDLNSCNSRGNWRILLPECEGEPEGYVQLQAIVTGCNMQFPMDDLMGFSGTMKVSGRPQLVIISG